MKKVVFALALWLFPLASMAATTLSFEELRDACQNPAKFHNQLAPSNIQVSCKGSLTTWVQVNQATIPLPGSHQLAAAVSSDKYNVNVVTGPVAMPAQQAICQRFKEITQNVETVRAATCEELVKFKGTALEYCGSVVNRLRETNPDAVKTVDSGRSLDLCAGKAVGAE